jgi:hypothetical protein
VIRPSKLSPLELKSGCLSRPTYSIHVKMHIVATLF